MAKKAKKEVESKVNQRLLGSLFYDIVDVSKQKVVQKLIENSESLNINKESIEQISNIIGAELDISKSWGFDILSKNLK